MECRRIDYIRIWLFTILTINAETLYCGCICSGLASIVHRIFINVNEESKKLFSNIAGSSANYEYTLNPKNVVRTESKKLTTAKDTRISYFSELIYSSTTQVRAIRCWHHDKNETVKSFLQLTLMNKLIGKITTPRDPLRSSAFCFRPGQRILDWVYITCNWC